MSNLTRRQILMFFGASAGAAAFGPELGETLLNLGSTAAQAAVVPFMPPYLPSPLPIYQEKAAFLPGTTTVIPPAPNPKLDAYTVVDDVVVPPEYERYVIVGWGDRVFPGDDYFGYNCDYTGYVPIQGEREGFLFVNHEYISFPFSKLAPEAPASVAPFPETYPQVIGLEKSFLPASYTSTGGTTRPTDRNDVDRVKVDGEFMYNQGVSVVRIQRTDSGRYVVSGNVSGNFKIHGLSGLGLNAQRTDGYSNRTGWGPRKYQQGDLNYLIGTGPAATQVFPLSTDGLGNRIIGTAYNCSGGNTPWGTCISAEENFQGAAGAFFVGTQEGVLPNGTQNGYSVGTTSETFGLVGEKYGWMVEVDPANPQARGKKHTALGRFRHENIAVRAEAGKKLVAYMGDDRRGGHTWKYVSNGTVVDPKSKQTSALLEDGTLYVAKFNEDGTGRWIPLKLDTPTNPNVPSELGSRERTALGSIQRNGGTIFPRRAGMAAGVTTDGGFFTVTTANEATVLPFFRGKTLATFYTSQGAVLCDAFAAANVIGGTPTARPEDIEISPLDPRIVFVAYTDGAPGGDGYPDSRIFQVAKLSAALNATQQSGGLYKITEDSADSSGLTFRWERFAQGGEAGANPGNNFPSSNPVASGFANVDNLVFDAKGNIWGVTDMSTGLHNGFTTGAQGTPVALSGGANAFNHARTGNVQEFVGAFGNNWMFYIPTTGPDAGKIIPFAVGPVRCEMTGPTFVGNTLILSVQHPGEDCPINDGTILSRQIEMLDLAGNTFVQTRTVPRGSSWPGNLPGTSFGRGKNIPTPYRNLPRPAVIGIRRKDGKQFV